MKSYIEPWISHKAKKLSSKIDGVGLFAVKTLKKDEIIANKGGHLMTVQEFYELPDICKEACIQIDFQTYRGPKTKNQAQKVMVGINHSCNPNIGLDSDYNTVAMRDIKIGEELTGDYCIAYSNDFFEFTCLCKQAKCRKKITSGDWMKKELQQRYDGYFSPFLAQAIKNSERP